MIRAIIDQVGQEVGPSIRKAIIDPQGCAAVSSATVDAPIRKSSHFFRTVATARGEREMASASAYSPKLYCNYDPFRANGTVRHRL